MVGTLLALLRGNTQPAIHDGACGADTSGTGAEETGRVGVRLQTRRLALRVIAVLQVPRAVWNNTERSLIFFPCVHVDEETSAAASTQFSREVWNKTERNIIIPRVHVNEEKSAAAVQGSETKMTASVLMCVLCLDAVQGLICQASLRTNKNFYTMQYRLFRAAKRCVDQLGIPAGSQCTDCRKPANFYI